MSDTLGFSSLSTASYEPLDLEGSLVVMAYLLPIRELRLARFVSVFLAWIKTYHPYLNTQKLYKMGLQLEKEVGSVPLLRLTGVLLRQLGPKRNRHFVFPPLLEPFYLEPRLKDLVDLKLDAEGFAAGFSREMNFMVPALGFKAKPSDLIGERKLFSRNEQLRNRQLFGVTNRSDAVYWLSKNPEMSACELSDTLCLSYEPAHRLATEIKRHMHFSKQEGSARV